MTTSFLASFKCFVHLKICLNLAFSGQDRRAMGMFWKLVKVKLSPGELFCEVPAADFGIYPKQRQTLQGSLSGHICALTSIIRRAMTAMTKPLLQARDVCKGPSHPSCRLRATAGALAALPDPQPACPWLRQPVASLNPPSGKEKLFPVTWLLGPPVPNYSSLSKCL